MGECYDLWRIRRLGRKIERSQESLPEYSFLVKELTEQQNPLCSAEVLGLSHLVSSSQKDCKELSLKVSGWKKKYSSLVIDYHLKYRTDRKTRHQQQENSTMVSSQR